MRLLNKHEEEELRSIHPLIDNIRNFYFEKIKGEKNAKPSQENNIHRF